MSPEHEPETQSLRGCFAAQKECREAIYKKLDTNHKETMLAIGEIKEALAFAEGEQAGARKDLKEEIIAQEAARVDARDEADGGFWKHPITVAVISGVLTAAIVGGILAYNLVGRQQ